MGLGASKARTSEPGLRTPGARWLDAFGLACLDEDVRLACNKLNKIVKAKPNAL